MRERLEVDYVSWLGDLAYGLGIIAFVMIVVGTATPAWVDTEVSTGLVLSNGKERNDIVFGRGLFQAYQYDGYGQYLILPIYANDANGSDLDPFCGNNNTVTSLSLLRDLVEAMPGFYRGRRYNTHDWCTKQQAATVFAIFTCLFAFSAVIATSCAQKGLCNQTPYMVCILCVFLTGLITFSIIAGFIDLESRRVSGQAVEERFFPFAQETVPGYSFIVFTLGVIIYLASLLLALFEKWCHEGKVEGGQPQMKLEASKA